MELANHFISNQVSRPADGMSHHRIGEINDAHTFLPRTVADIHVFHIHKELLVKAFQFFPGFSLEAHCRSAHPVHLADLIVGPVLHKVVPQKGVSWKQFSQRSVTKQRCHRGGKFSATILEGSVRIEQLGSQYGYRGVFFHIVNDFF